LESGLSASWERRLFALAHEPLQGDNPYVSVHADPETLERAYGHCVAVTQEHSKTFYMASALLPPAKRRAVRALCLLPNQRRPGGSWWTWGLCR
jgi:hypothetical protein